MIISGFPGTGKTTFGKKYPNLAVDLESSDFQYDLEKLKKQGLTAERMKGMKSRVAKENWQENYVKEALKLNKKYRFVFISPNPEVIRKVIKSGEKPILITPSQEDFIIYLKRYVNRGNNIHWIKRMFPFFEKIPSLEKEFEKSCEVIHLSGNQTMEDLLLSEEFTKNH